jgi:hypothetical protein
MLIIECEQRSDQWFAERLGKPSASRFHEILTPGGQVSDQRKKYMYKLAAQTISGRNAEEYQSAAMQTGTEREEESRMFYEMLYGVEVKQVGLIFPDDKKQYLCSPDGIMPEIRRGLELKNVEPHTQIETLVRGVMPTKHIPQVQGSMLVTGFESWHFMSFSPGLPPLIIEVQRDSSYIAALAGELECFNNELAMLVERIRGK